MRIGNAPCSWGVFYPTGNAITAEAYLDAVARAGYRFTELGPLGFLPEDPAWISDALAARGLALTGAAHVHILPNPAQEAELTRTFARLCRLLAALDCPDVILMDESEAYDPGAQGHVDAAGWRQVLAGLVRARAIAADHGLRLLIHPHVGTCIETEAQIDRLLAETDLDLCFDTGHHAFWDQDVPAFLSRASGRIGQVHLKNVNPAVRARVLAGALGVNASFDQGVMCALPDGAVDIAAVLRLLKTQGYQGSVVVEQDPARDAAETPEALARRNLAFVTKALA